MKKEDFRKIARPVREIENPKVREAMKEAGIIWGCDTASDNVSLFYGRDRLEDIAQDSTSKFDTRKIIAFELDFRTGELEDLYAAIEVLCGSCCYESEDD